MTQHEPGLTMRVVQLAWAVTRTTAWSTIKRLPVAILLSFSVCSLTGLIVWWLGVRDADPDSLEAVVGTLALVFCFPLAALLWALHFALYGGTLRGIGMLEQQSSGFMDSVLHPILARVPGRDKQIPIAEVRRTCKEALEHVLPTDETGSWRLLRRVSRWVVRWTVRAELTAVESVLRALEERGEQHLSVDALKSYVCARTATSLGQTARGQMFVASCWVAGIVFLLLAGPAVVVL